jgi:site-specific DNA-methyltransferase (adenine-specific)
VLAKSLLKIVQESCQLTLPAIAEKTGVSVAYLSWALKDNLTFPPSIEKKFEDLVGSKFLESQLSQGFLPKNFQNTVSKYAKEIACLIQGLQQCEEQTEDCSTSSPAAYLPVVSTKLGKLFNLDCVDFLRTLDSETVDCVFADPPFNLGKDYKNSNSDSLEKELYLSWCYEWLGECIRVLKPGGSLFVYNLPSWNSYLSAFLSDYLKFKNWIAISLPTGFPIQKRLGAAHYSLLYFVKGEHGKSFNPPRIPIDTCRHCGGDIRDYGGHKSKLNPNGLNITDVWTDIPLVRHKKLKTREFANELSLKMMDRILDIGSNEQDLVLDPFGGSGTTFIAAELKNRRWIGSEIGVCSVVEERLNNLHSEKEKIFQIAQSKNKLYANISSKKATEKRAGASKEIIGKVKGSRQKVKFEETLF